MIGLQYNVMLNANYFQTLDAFVFNFIFTYYLFFFKKLTK